MTFSDLKNISVIYENFDKFLYHATYKPLIKSIKKFGLGGGEYKSNWEDSKNVVYLATDPDIAESYAESSDYVDEDWLDQIILLSVLINDLDLDLLKRDENVIDGGDTFEYHGVIPFDKLKLVYS